MADRLTFLALATFLALGIYFLFLINTLSAVPTFVVGTVALGFSYYAYLFSKEKFRLDLLEKRWAVYEEILKFCSGVLSNGGIPEYNANNPEKSDLALQTLFAAEGSFKGLGYHKAASLFGQDVSSFLNKLHDCYVWFSINGRPNNEENLKKSMEYSKFLQETVNNMPNIFKAYVYFGNYKNDSI